MYRENSSNLSNGISTRLENGLHRVYSSPFARIIYYIVIRLRKGKVEHYVTFRYRLGRLRIKERANFRRNFVCGKYAIDHKVVATR